MHDRLDSRASLGSDIHRGGKTRTEPVEESTYIGECRAIRVVRVILGRLGDCVRISAPDLDIVVDDADIESGWTRFLASVRARPDAGWLAFDVGPTRPEELDAGLDAPEDEDWSSSAASAED